MLVSANGSAAIQAMQTLHQSREDTIVADKYRVLFELGRGGTANVFLAVAEGPNGFNKLLVLKLLKDAYAEDDGFRAMFINEARLSARLNHPNVVQVIEVVEHEQLPVLVMEYLPGKSWAEARSRAGAELTLPMRLHVLSQLLRGLHYSHELVDYNGALLELVHRDMTPQNVFLTYDGHVKILDFGIAKLNGSLIETQVGVVKGKVRYMPVEQIDGSGVDRRADVFAVGVMLWEAVTGSRMWQGLTDVEIMRRILDGDIPTPSSVLPEVDWELERMCVRALAAHAADRYATAEHLQVELEQYLAAHAPGVGAREIAAVMRHCFADEQDRTAQLIEEKLGHVSLLQTLGADELRHSRIAPIAERRNSSAAQAAVRTSFRLRDHKLAIPTLVAFFAVGALIGGYRWSLNPRGPATQALQLRGAVDAPAQRPRVVPPVAPGVVVNSEAGLPTPGVVDVPLPLTAPADGSAGVVGTGSPVNRSTSTRDGVQGTTRGFTADSAATLRAAAPPRPKSGVGATPTTTNQPPSAASVGSTLKPTSPECTTPFFINERGIKKFKPECL